MQCTLHVIGPQRCPFQSDVMQLTAGGTVLQPGGDCQAGVEGCTQTDFGNYELLASLKHRPALAKPIALDKHVVALGQTIISRKINVPQ